MNRKETAWLSRRVPNPHNCPVAIPSCGRGKIRWIQTTSNLENVQPLPEAENPAEIWPLLHRTYVRDVPAPLAPQLPIATDIKERVQLQKVIAHSAKYEFFGDKMKRVYYYFLKISLRIQLVEALIPGRR